MRRFLCLYFPRWPIQYLRQIQPQTRGKPIAIFKRVAQGRFIVLCSKEANGLGVRRGMPMADATALVPDLRVFEADFSVYRQALEKLCLWAGRFSPLAGVEAECAAIEHAQSVLLDITGCEQVFKGEEQLLAQAVRALQRRHLQVRAAIAPTIGAAWALAHYAEPNSILRELRIADCGLRIGGGEGGGATGSGAAVCALASADSGDVQKTSVHELDSCQTASALAELQTAAPQPVAPPRQSKIAASQSAIRNPQSAMQSVPLAGLRIESEVIVHLNKLGLHRIGEILEQPRSTLPSRFGPQLIQRIDQLLGDLPEMVPLLRPAPEIRVARAFEYPVKNCELLLKIIEQMVGDLSRELRTRNKGARQIECWLYREAADPLCIDISLFKSSACKKHLMQLLRTRLETLPRLLAQGKRKVGDRDAQFEAEEGLCAVALHVVSSEKLDAGQMDLFEKEAASESGPSAGICVVVDRIVSRLGPEAAVRATVVADAQPELACALRISDCGGDSVLPNPGGLRTGTVAAAQSAIRNPQSAMNNARPLRLLPEPLALLPGELRADGFPASFEGHSRKISVACAHGPERIETGWWRAAYVRRDYFIVDSNSGSRYWIFRRLDDGRWFLHGVFE